MILTLNIFLTRPLVNENQPMLYTKIKHPLVMIPSYFTVQLVLYRQLGDYQHGLKTHRASGLDLAEV